MSDRSDILFRRVLVLSGFLLFVLGGVRESLLERTRPVDFFMWIAVAVIAVKFCIVDYRIRGRTLIHSYHWLIFFTWPFALPVYLLCSRGIGKGIVAILLGLAGMCVASAMAYGVVCLIWLFGWVILESPSAMFFF